MSQPDVRASVFSWVAMGLAVLAAAAVALFIPADPDRVAADIERLAAVVHLAPRRAVEALMDCVPEYRPAGWDIQPRVRLAA